MDNIYIRHLFPATLHILPCFLTSYIQFILIFHPLPLKPWIVGYTPKNFNVNVADFITDVTIP